jgi:SNF2 family DNA or RNA helicase
MKVELSSVNSSPVLVFDDPTSTGSRVFGASMNSEKTHWRVPAFPPFLDKVLHDLEVVYKSFSLSPSAEKYVLEQDEEACYARAAAWKSFGPYQDYAHQTNGLGKLLYNYRYVLQWEMGTGKTKPVVELSKMLGTKVLILCPLVAAKNWVKEITLHSGGTLSAVAMVGTRNKKMELLDTAPDVNIFVATYDVARMYGVPHVATSAQAILRKKGFLRIPTHLSKTLKLTSNGTLQTRLVEEWSSGRKIADIAEEIAETNNGKLQWLSDIDGDMIVADESHRIKHISSQRTVSCLKLASKFPRRYLLSGTLNLGDPRDLFPQMKFLAPYILSGDYDTFCDKYVIRSPYNRAIVTGYKNLDKLNRVVTRISDRRELNDCVDLPERTDETLYYALTAAQIKDYNNAINYDEIVKQDSSIMPINNGAIRLNKLLQICSGFYYVNSSNAECDACSHLPFCFENNVLCGSPECRNRNPLVAVPEKFRKYSPNPKLELLKDFLEDLLSSNTHKVIIWANFTEELNDIEDLLRETGYGYVRLDGSTSKNTAEYEDKFQRDPAYRVFLGQIKTGISITLTAAQYMIYYSRSWSLEDWLQSRGRNYRIGQKNKTVVYSFCARDTVEVQQLAALNAKKDVASTLTKHFDCLLCGKYSECLKAGTVPWTSNCILEKNMKRKTTRARVVEEG